MKSCQSKRCVQGLSNPVGTFAFLEKIHKVSKNILCFYFRKVLLSYSRDIFERAKRLFYKTSVFTFLPNLVFVTIATCVYVFFFWSTWQKSECSCGLWQTFCSSFYFLPCRGAQVPQRSELDTLGANQHPKASVTMATDTQPRNCWHGDQMSDMEVTPNKLRFKCFFLCG